jgi:dipeptidyl aminopeptidase/acylaminoacyl peptidase
MEVVFLKALKNSNTHSISKYCHNKLPFFFLPLTLILLHGIMPVTAQEHLTYQMPPRDIAELIDAPRTPRVIVDPEGEWLLMLEQPELRSIEDLAQPELRLAGLKINPKTNGRSRPYYSTGMRFLSIDSGEDKTVTGLPSDPKIENVKWSPDGEYVAFTVIADTGLSLWVITVDSMNALQLTEPVINDAYYGYPYEWLSDSRSLMYKSILRERGSPPEKQAVPSGPVVQENLDTAAPVRTYQDLLRNSHDESLFEYYMTSRLMKVDLKGEKKAIGSPGIIRSFQPSPDGRYLLVETITRPFSYMVPSYRFPLLIEVWDGDGKVIRQIAHLPLAEDIPQDFDAVRKGPRNVSWRADAPASLFWAEAQDEGDPARDVTVHDALFRLEVPFSGDPVEVLSLRLRCRGVTWGNEALAVVHERWWKNRRTITSFFHPDSASSSKDIVFDRYWEDRYSDPGDFVTVSNECGMPVLLMNDRGDRLFLFGEGASPEGDRPFIDRFDLKGKQIERLWRSTAPFYETPVRIVDVEKGILLTRRESQDTPPNYFLRDLKSGAVRQRTDIQHPYPHLRGVTKQLIRYERKDGVPLTASLYLPPDYTQGKRRLPVLMWAYPEEYKSVDAAGQVRDSPYRFPRIGWWSPLLWLTRGFAIVDDPAMPVVGEGDEEPNDTYVKQLVLDAEAAIEALVEMGIADRRRIAIGGHSYGAFMAANLLAHSDLFAAGIARTGAYNRTLTPFGFQSEERTLWDAIDTYIEMSPFMYADRIEEPLLLIHGQSDSNAGTYPMQSERFYQALKGHGATVRFVLLPHEGHSYRARESIMHMAWEMTRWLERYVANKPFTVPERQRRHPD